MPMVSSCNAVHTPLEHQVFINFRGKELRGSFVSHLVKALKTEGINVFIDNNTRMGKDLKIFFKEIEDSCIAIAVISSLYSESKWCLNELAKIRECVNKKTLEVFPVFYKVSVDTVKYRKDMFGENFDRLVKRGHTKRNAWKRALKFVTKKKGEIVDEKSDEVQVINKIVNDVRIKLEEVRTDKETKSPRENICEVSKGGGPISSSAQTPPFIGITTRLQQLEEKLDFELDEVTRVIGVVGMPGIGKTTLAKKLFEKWGPEFLNIMFVDDIRKKSKSPGFNKLHMDLLHGLIRSAHDGRENKDIEGSLESLKTKLRKSKVFIVLDDVSEKVQIDMILGGREWLREGSRVVITTSSMSVVKEMVDETYLVPGLSDEDGFKYFEKHAFSGSCEPSFKKLAKEFVDYSRGHPLALKELGRELLAKDKAYWVSKLETLAKSPISNTIQDVLRTPYDDLSKQHKDLFLDVARFFRFEDGYHVRSLLDSSVHENVSEIRNLADKFLINICGGRLEVNDLMYTFAMGLESQPSSENSTSGRRLFNHRDIITILRNNEVKEATKIRGMFLDMSEIQKKISFGSDTFKEMNDLRYLKFFDSSCTKESEAKCNLNFPNGLDFTLQEIRYLHWLKFPLKKLPQDFNPKNLIDLKLPYSKIEQVWDGEKDTSKLKWLDLNHSSKLRTLSGLSNTRKLQSLNLEGCTELKTVHEELENMKSLIFLNLKGCTSLKSLPQMKLISLKILILSGCSNLEEFNLTPQSLEELYLDGTAIKELPAMIGNLQKLVLFTLKDCRRLTTLPDSIGNLKALQKFVLSGCKNFKIFPEVKENMKHLKTLLLDGTAIQEMPRLLKRFIVNQGETSSCSDCSLREWPHEIYTLSSVQRLSLSRNSFRSLPKNISFLYNLKWLDLKYCEQLISLPVLPPSLHWLDAHGCVALEDIESPLALILAETEHSHFTFAFTNCTKLDQVAKNGIISYVWRKIQLMSDALAHQEKGSKLNVLIRVCYPGWQVPVWFNHRTVGSELKQKLHRHWNEAGLTGIALCAVVSFKNYQAQNNRLLVRCNIDFKEEDEPLKQFSCNLGGWTEHGKDRPRDIIKSFGHVFVGYTNLLHIKKRDIEAECLATEASFKFEVTDGTKQITDCEVLKCGFTLIWAPTKPVHRLYTEKHTDHDEITPGSTTKSEGNINSKESHFQIRNEATSVPSVALPMGCKTRKKVESLEDKSSVAPSTSNGEEAPSTSNGEEAPSVVSYNATLNICDSMRAESVSPGSSGSEVIDEESPENDEESPNNDETNQEVKNTTCFSFFQHFTSCLP